MNDKARILVVDDERGVRESLRIVLEPRYDIRTVESGEAAFRILPEFRPDLVLVDLKMPGMDGLEVLQRLKVHDPTIEVIVITAYASDHTLRQSLTQGASEYVIKPFGARELEETVRQALSRRTRSRGAPARADAPRPVRIGLVGGGRGGSALLDLLLDWPGAQVAVVADPRTDAPGLAKARARGLPTAASHRDVFGHPVDLVLEVTGRPDVLDDLLRAKPSGVEVIGAAGLRFFWDLLDSKVAVNRQFRAQLDLALAIESSLNLPRQLGVVTQKLAEACGVDRCSLFLWEEATGLVTVLASECATGESAEPARPALTGAEGLKLTELPFLYEVMERRGPIEIDDPASSPLVPPGWAERFRLKSLLIVPLFRRQRVVGACVLDYFQEPRRFTPAQLVLATALASQVGLALDNVRLYVDAADKARRLAALLETTKRTASIKDSGHLLPWIAQEAASVLKADGAGIRLLEDEELVYAAHYGYSREGMRDRVALGESGTGWTVRHNRPLAIPDLEADPRMVADHRHAYRREGFRSMLAVPMGLGARVIGALFVFTRNARHFSETDVEILSGFAGQAALAVDNLRLYEEVDRRRRAAESLAELGRLLSQSLDPQEVGQRVAASIRTLLGAHSSALFRLDPASEDLIAVAVSDTVRPIWGDRTVFPKGVGVAALAVRDRQPVVAPDLLSDPRVVLTPDVRAKIERAAYRSVLSVPLLVKDTVIGVLSVGDRQGRIFTEEEIRLAQAFADQAAVALENSRLYADAARRRQEAEELARVVRTLTESLDLATLGERMTESVLPLFGVHSSGLRLLQADGSLVAIAYGGDSRGYFEVGHVLPPGVGIAGLAVRTGVPVSSPDVLGDPRLVFTDDLRRRLLGSGTRAFLAVPLRVKAETIGVLTIADRAPRVFSDAEVALLQAFADQAALALENARLYQQATEHTRKLTALSTLTHRITAARDSREVFNAVSAAAAALLGAKMARVWVDDPQAGVLRAQGNFSADPALGAVMAESSVIPHGSGLVGRIFQSRRAAYVRDVQEEPHWLNQPLARQADLHAFAGLPLITGERIVGVLAILFGERRSFSREEQELMTLLAAQAAVAIEQARLFEELTRSYEEIQHTQEQLVQSEKLKALGEMAGGVAHDFNNTLAAILGRAQLLLTQTDTPELQRQLQVIEKVATDGARTVRRIQEFTRTRRARPFQALDLNQVVEEVIEVTRARWKDEAQAKGIVYDVAVEATSLPPVLGDPSELREALANLVFNALDAMPGGGRLSFRTGVEGERVYCTITDTGVGMPEDVRQRIFDPFFTTKGEKGTGLGLSVVYGIVTRHGGTIDIESHVGRGSTFTLWLPVARELPEAPEALPAPPHPCRRARVLIIDDDEEVRDVLRDLLVEDGHGVNTCADGRSALRRLQEEPCDLVITDLGMPGLSGWQVADEIKRRYPHLPLALVTGWADRIDPAEARAKGVDFLLAKPFTVEDLRQVVTDALAGPIH